MERRDAAMTRRVAAEVRRANLTRRGFLELLGASFVAGCLGCSRPGDVPAKAARPYADVPFGVWREMRTAIRSSPDHLAARAARLAEARDVQGIFAFVRDEIATYPAHADGIGNRLGDAAAATRWGVRGTLRCGAGTPREKAELLAGLLRDGGFEAEVVAGRLDAGADPRAILFRAVERTFAPDVDSEQVQAWAQALGVRRRGPRPVLDADGAESKALGERILAALPADAVAPDFDFTLKRIPLVRAIIEGREQYLNPLVPDAGFGEARADQIGRAPAPSEPRPLEVAVQIATSDDPVRRITVLDSRWPVEDVTGRRLVLQFLPVGDLQAALRVPLTQIRAVTPVLALDDANAPLAELAERSRVGATVTVGGDVLDADEAGRLRFNGEALGADDPAAANRVAAVDVQVSATGFPVIRLRVAARDAAGRPVPGLAADAFTVREQGAALPFLLRQSRPPRPKLLLLLDLSNSLPADFRGNGAAALARRLTESVLARYPDASIQVASVSSGSAAGLRGWLNDPSEVEATARRLTGFGSALWSALASARRFGPNVIALVSDGGATDTDEQLAKARPSVAAGPAVVSIAVGDVQRAALDEISALTGGAVYEAHDHTQAAEAIVRQLEAREERGIVIEYEAPLSGPADRTVELRAGTAAGTAGYRVPDAAERLAMPGLAGLYLVVRRGGREVVRTLAGLTPDRASTQTPVDQATRDEVRAALFGTTLLSVEAGAPTFAAWLDDMLTARLTWEPLWEPGLPQRPGSVASAMEAGIRVVPTHTLLLHPPLEQGGDALTFETEPRLLLLGERPLHDGGVLRTADLLPLGGWRTAARDAREAFRLTVQRTARLAVVEEKLYTDSTTARLGARALEYVAPVGTARGGAAQEWTELLREYSGRHRLVPADEGEFAFWAADRSGSLLGILPDGSGGGKSKDANQGCKTINQGAAMMQLGGGALGLPFAYGAAVLLFKAIAKQYLRAAAIVAALGGPLPDTGGCGDAGDLPCDLLKDVLTDNVPGLKAVGVADDLAEAATGKDLIDCQW